MLVLGVGVGAESAAWQRMAVTLVGAAVGIATNLLFPPKVASADAGRAIDGLADAVSNLLNRAADELTELAADRRDLAAAARAWLGEARRHHPHDIPRVGAAPPARGAGAPAQRPRRRHAQRGAGAAPGARGAGALRGRDPRDVPRAGGRDVRTRPGRDDETTETVLLGLAQTFREMAAGVDAFGQLVHDEAGPGEAHQPRATCRSSVRRSTGCTRRAPGSTTCSWRAPRPSCSSCTPRCCRRSSGCCARWTSPSGSGARSGCCARPVRDSGRRHAPTRQPAARRTGAQPGRGDAGAAEAPRGPSAPRVGSRHHRREGRP